MPDPAEPLLDLDTRRRIFRHIEANPGLHLRGLQRAMDMPLGTIEYHLHQMERSKLISSRDDGRFKAFFVTEGLDRRDKDVLYYVRQEMPRQIMIRLLMEPRQNHTTLVAALPISASTCSFHVKKLVTAGLVVEERVGRSKVFEVADPDRVASVLVRYRKSFLDDIVDRFARAWLDMGNIAPPQAADEGAGGADAADASTADQDRDPEDASDEQLDGKAHRSPGPLDLVQRIDQVIHAFLAWVAPVYWSRSRPRQRVDARPGL